MPEQADELSINEVIARSAVCPTCGAQPGDPCEDERFEEFNGIHGARTRALLGDGVDL